MQTGWSDHSSSHATPGSITVTERAEVHTKMILIISEVIRKYEHNASQCVITQSIMVTCAGRPLYNKVLKVCITFLDNERWGSDAVYANTISLAATVKILS